MKTIAFILCSLLLLISCGNVSIITQDALNEGIKEYLVEGVVLSDEPPAEGYHSPKKVIEETAIELVNSGFLDLVKDGERRDWLIDCTLEEPVVVYNFKKPGEGDTRCDINYIVYGTHPDHGVVGVVLYKYYEYSDIDWGVCTVSPPEIRDGNPPKIEIMTKDEAINIFKSKVDSNYQGEPIAVVLPSYDHTTQLNFSWYFEVPNRSGSHDEYVMNCMVNLSVVKSRGLSNGAQIERINSNLNLFDAVREIEDGSMNKSYSSIPEIRHLDRSMFTRIQ